MNEDLKSFFRGLFTLIVIAFISISGNIYLNYAIVVNLLITLFLAFIVLSIIVTILFYLIITRISTITKELSIYHPLIKRIDPDNPQFGEETKTKLWEVFKRNIYLSLALFVTLSFILLPFIEWGASGLQNDAVSLTSADLALLVIAIILPGFVLSLRVLSNPTKYKFSIKSFKRIQSHHDELRFISCNRDSLSAIRTYKERIVSFYFSFIATSLILAFIIGYYEFFILWKNTKRFSEDITFQEIFPSMNLTREIIIALLILEFISICFATLFGELYLDAMEPIDQI